MTELEEFLSELEERTGKEMGARNFDSRLRIQKAVYLLQEMGRTVNSRTFEFNNYYNGPYSPALAREYYGDDDEPDLNLRHGEETDLPDGIVSTIEEAVNRGTEFLEAVATLDKVARRNRTSNRDVAIRTTKRLKPDLSEGLLKEAWAFLEEKGIQESTT